MPPWGPSNFTDLIRALGEPEFPRRLLDALNERVCIGHIAIIAFDSKLKGHSMAAESTGLRTLAQTAGQIYEAARFYRHDPSAALIATHPDQHRPLLFHLRPQDITDTEYRAQIYEKFHLIERVSMVEYFAGRWNTISLYRDAEAGPFSEEDLRRIKEFAEPMAALAAKHYALAPVPDWQRETHPSVEQLEDIVRGLDPALTPRQVQVCARALTGMTNTAIGLDLGVQVPTVATLRARAYAVLNISSLNELFALCLARTLPPSENMPDTPKTAAEH